jgi:hypothetical protein
LEIKELAALDPTSLVDAELSEAVVELAQLRRSLEATEARIAHAWDARRVWAVDALRSGAAWLVRETRDPRADCRRRIALGRACGQLPLAAEAWSAGDIDAAHVRRLAGARNGRTALLLQRDEGLLVHHALELTFGEFAQAVDYWTLHADPDGAEQSDVDRRDRRRVALDSTFTGMYSGSMLLDPISGSIVAGELDAREHELFEVTGALRRLIEVRDRHCYHRHCDEPAHRCQIDHIEPWTNGGITSQDNGRLACGYHNRLRHRRRPPPPPPPRT